MKEKNIADNLRFKYNTNIAMLKINYLLLFFCNIISNNKYIEIKSLLSYDFAMYSYKDLIIKVSSNAEINSIDGNILIGPGILIYYDDKIALKINYLTNLEYHVLESYIICWNAIIVGISYDFYKIKFKFGVKLSYDKCNLTISNNSHVLERNSSKKVVKKYFYEDLFNNNKENIYNFFISILNTGLKKDENDFDDYGEKILLIYEILFNRKNDELDELNFNVYHNHLFNMNENIEQIKNNHFTLLIMEKDYDNKTDNEERWKINNWLPNNKLSTLIYYLKKENRRNNVFISFQILNFTNEINIEKYYAIDIYQKMNGINMILIPCLRVISQNYKIQGFHYILLQLIKNDEEEWEQIIYDSYESNKKIQNDVWSCGYFTLAHLIMLSKLDYKQSKKYYNANINERKQYLLNLLTNEKIKPSDAFGVQIMQLLKNNYETKNNLIKMINISDEKIFETFETSNNIGR